MLNKADGPEAVRGAAKLRQVAVFANELCGIACLAEAKKRESALKLLVAQMQKKFREYSGTFEIDVKSSDFCNALTAWVTPLKKSID